jgi:hypothetical protein
MGDADSSQGRKTLTAAALDPHDRARLRELKRTKWLAGGVLIASLTVLVIAKLLERHNAGFGFLAAFTCRSRIPPSSRRTIARSRNGSGASLRHIFSRPNRSERS